MSSFRSEIDSKFSDRSVHFKWSNQEVQNKAMDAKNLKGFASAAFNVGCYISSVYSSLLQHSTLYLLLQAFMI